MPQIPYRNMVITLGTLLMGSLSTASAADTLVYEFPENEPVIILYDQVGPPARWAIEPAPKIALTEDLLKLLAPKLAGRSDISLRSFGGSLSSHRDTACNAHNIAVPFGRGVTEGNINAFTSALKADGEHSNHSFAIKRAIKDLQSVGGGRILIISDTPDSCEGDHSLVADTAPDNVKIDVIAVGPMRKTYKLSSLSLGTNGQFYGVGSIEDLGIGGPSLDDVLPVSEEESDGEVGIPDGTGDILASGSSREAPTTSGPLFAGGPSRISVSLGEGAQNCSRVSTENQAGETASDPIAIQFILDASGSMAARKNGVQKMKIAKDALAAVIDGLEDKSAVTSLRAYGFDDSVDKTEEASCPNTEMIVGFGTNQSVKIKSAARQLNPYGYTPLAASLIASQKDLADVQARSRYTILITDGEETCGGDPVTTADSMFNNTQSVNTVVVGFDLNPVQQEQMKAVAYAGGGEYLDAPSGEELNKALKYIIDFTVLSSEIPASACAPKEGDQ